MKSEILSQEGNRLKIKATVEAPEFQKALNTVVGELSRKANIKGFRKGRVPRNIIEMYFGREGIYSEALEKVLPAAMNEISEEYDLNLIAEPQVDLEGDVEEGKDITAVFTFEVRPEVTLPALSSIVVERPVIEITDSMVESAIEQIRQRHSELRPVTDRSSREGDSVSVEYTTVVLEEGGDNTPSPVQKATLRLDQESLREELKKALTGRSQGDEESVEFDVEAEHPDASVAGKKLRYSLKVTEVLERILPAIDEELVRKYSQGRIDNLESFRNDVSERLEAQVRHDTENATQAGALAKLREEAQVDVPESLVERQVLAMKDEEAEQVRKQFNLSMEEYLEKNGIDTETFEKSIRERAQRTVRQTLILEALADERSIEVNEQDIDAEVKSLSEYLKSDPDRVRSLLFKDRDRMTDFLHRIRMNKTINLIMSEVTVKDVPMGNGSEGETDSPEETHA